MKYRFFRCSCNHKLRYGTTSCSYCFKPTPIYNRWWFLPVLAIIAAIIYYLTASEATALVVEETRLRNQSSLR